jgi:hypothetical protein
MVPRRSGNCRLLSTTIALLFIVIIQSTIRANAIETPIACAIRWDANYTNGPSDPGFFTAKALSPMEFRGRAPLHAQFDAKSAISWSPTPPSMDYEIQIAERGGFCWVFLVTGRNGQIDLQLPMNRAFTMMKMSSNRMKVRISIMVGTDNFGSTGHYTAAVDKIANIIGEPNYLAVGDRRVLWIPVDKKDIDAYWGADIGNFAEAINYLRRRTVELGLGRPYIVLLAASRSVASALQADAISRYAIIPPFENRETYGRFIHSVEDFWDAEVQQSSTAVIPTVMLGWDPRPRYLNPPPWVSHTALDLQHFIEAPTTTEIKEACQHAADWVRHHAERSAEGLVLIYSWNESDEAGTVLGPTIADPTGIHSSACATGLKTVPQPTGSEYSSTHR